MTDEETQTTTRAPKVQIRSQSRDIPLAQIAELRTSYPDGVSVRVSRRDHRGRFNTVQGGYGMSRTLEELAEPEPWLSELAGGGHYSLMVLDPNDPTQQILPTFEVRIEGASRAGGSAPAAQRRNNGRGGAAPPSRHVNADAYPGPLGVQYHGPVGVQQDERSFDAFRESTADTVERLDGLLREMRERYDRLEQQQQTEQKRHQAQLEAERAARLELEQKHREERHRHEMDLIRAEIKQSTALAPTPDRNAAFVDIAKVVAPLLVTMMTSGSERSQRQMELMMGLATKKDDGGSAQLMAAITPLITKSMDARSPKAMAELIGTMSEGQAHQLAMFSELLQAAAADQPDNPWYGLIERGFKSLQDVARNMSGAMQEQLLDEPEDDPELSADTRAANIAAQIMGAPNLPEGLRTDKWRRFFERMHAKDDVRALAHDIALHLEQLERSNQLPPIFAGLFQSDAPASDLLERLVTALPIAQMDRAYTRRLLTAFDEVLAMPDDNQGDTGRDTAFDDDDDASEVEVVGRAPQH